MMLQNKTLQEITISTSQISQGQYQGQGGQVCLGWAIRCKIAAPENWNSGQAGILQDYETVKTERDFGNGH